MNKPSISKCDLQTGAPFSLTGFRAVFRGPLVNLIVFKFVLLMFLMLYVIVIIVLVFFCYITICVHEEKF